jgi:hypothetical protein
VDEIFADEDEDGVHGERMGMGMTND